MLAGKCTNKNNIKYPVLATPKLDGIGCLVIDGNAVSRTFKEKVQADPWSSGLMGFICLERNLELICKWTDKEIEEMSK